jgi:hypothetical protein
MAGGMVDNNTAITMAIITGIITGITIMATITSIPIR